VGTGGLSAIRITSAEGRILIDGGLAGAAPRASSASPGFVGLDEKIARRGEAKSPWIDPRACRVYAENASKALEARVAQEAEAPAPKR